MSQPRKLMAQVVEMKFCKLLLCTAVLFCMIAQVCAQGEQSPASNTYSDPATNEIKQFIEGPQNTDLSQKGKPPAESSLAKMEIGKTQTTTPQNYLVKADLFLDGITAFNLYAITVPDFINNSHADPKWTILDIRPSERYAAEHIENAMNIPFADLVLMMNMIPAGNKIAVYSDYDTNAAFGVMTLRVFGDRDAWILQGGVPAWQSAGMTVV
ncbi:MAG: rhodanese-like domain-containing protein [Methanothrix sp.]|jgi:rhodanese-related sulfurtransferase|nr:rhodanese-like domain-containing protein [Methanothrix sp.]